MFDMNTLVVGPVFDQFSRPITITPLASQPGVHPYPARGTYFTQPIDVMTDGNVIFSDQRTMLALRVADFGTMPMPLDRVNIPAHMSMPSPGDFEIADIDEIGGTGKVHCTLKRVTIPLP